MLLDDRRRLLLSAIDRKFYVFKEGEGLLAGSCSGEDDKYLTISTSYIQCRGNNTVIHHINQTTGESYTTTGHEANTVKITGFDVTKYKTLYIDVYGYGNGCQIVGRSVSGRETISIDVSNRTGTFTINGISGLGASSNIRIYNIWLE